MVIDSIDGTILLETAGRTKKKTEGSLSLMIMTAWLSG
jgi:hypothetical protein